MSGEKSEPKPKLAAQLEKALEEVGIVVLKNEAVKLLLPENKNPSEPLYLVGIGAHQPNNYKPKVALKQLPDNSPRIAIMHNTKTLEAFPPQTAPMAIAGHTHSRQIRIPFTPQWSWLTATKKLEHVSSWSGGEQGSGNRIHVNRGIGMSIIPVRFNCPPELTLFTLRAQ
ncbi:MAG: hypothetical protein BRC59_04735 [Cyanobacteria bacterium SW_4_48_29]|nr:MAG: hypothetical protein BRC42_11620 [Cyanobacteria bacterium QS_1_48_34]PSP14787.1 MAG: hypothetical protein BRC50_01370 [Cyanobacteria bacterium SW_11_48_12]PSP30180.1 MAG: hypothetical protein BRC59_04735 [Cyanobacteria bacterium SW_4_48_29]